MARGDDVGGTQAQERRLRAKFGVSADVSQAKLAELRSRTRLWRLGDNENYLTAGAKSWCGSPAGLTW